jgi:hypothetical protein
MFFKKQKRLFKNIRTQRLLRESCQTSADFYKLYTFFYGEEFDRRYQKGA